MSEITRGQFTHFLPITVRWGEMDALGHVNNTVYYRYSEDGRLDYFEKIDVGEPSLTGSGPILADLGCSFLQQLRYPAQIEVATRSVNLGNTSVKISQALFEQGGATPLAVFRAVIVWFDYAAQSSVTVPEVIRANIRQLERLAPEE